LTVVADDALERGFADAIAAVKTRDRRRIRKPDSYASAIEQHFDQITEMRAHGATWHEVTRVFKTAGGERFAKLSYKTVANVYTRLAKQRGGAA
jgi:hypothetical protein